MDLYKHICKHIVIPLWARWEASPYLKHLDYLDRSQYFPVSRIQEIQWEKIKQLLDHAYANCTHYREQWDAARISPFDIRSFDDFRSIPILTKQEVREFAADLIAPNVDQYMHFLTSGSTGKPLSGFRNKKSNEFQRACIVRSQLWAGYDLGERIYCLYGDPEKELSGIRKLRAKLRRTLLYRTENLDMLNLSEDSILAFTRKMQLEPPSLLWGHAHGLYLLARFLERKRISGIIPKGIYSAGMVLHSWEREKIEDVFHCKIQDRYGCEELGLIAAECKEQQGLHINTDCHYVEFLRRDGTAAAPGEAGQIIITDLTNWAMPFIRYRLEDICFPSERRCPCGRTQPLIERIEGRVADFLVTPSGKLVSGISLTDHFAGYIPGISQIQIVQELTDLLLLRIVKENTYGPESEKAIQQLVKEFFGPDMRYQFEFLDTIPRGERGKFRFTICKVQHGLFEQDQTKHEEFR